jgi:hypothetical protein
MICGLPRLFFLFLANVRHFLFSQEVDTPCTPNFFGSNLKSDELFSARSGGVLP